LYVTNFKKEMAWNEVNSSVNLDPVIGLGWHSKEK